MPPIRSSARAGLSELRAVQLAPAENAFARGHAGKLPPYLRERAG